MHIGMAGGGRAWCGQAGGRRQAAGGRWCSAGGRQVAHILSGSMIELSMRKFISNKIHNTRVTAIFALYRIPCFSIFLQMFSCM